VPDRSRLERLRHLFRRRPESSGSAVASTDGSPTPGSSQPDRAAARANLQRAATGIPGHGLPSAVHSSDGANGASSGRATSPGRDASPGGGTSPGGDSGNADSQAGSGDAAQAEPPQRGNGQASRTVTCQDCQRPAYPESALEAGVEGQPQVTVQINPDGSVASVTLERSSGNAAIDEAAIQAAQRSRFQPIAGGARVPIEYDLSIEGSERHQNAQRRGERHSTTVASPASPEPVASGGQSTPAESSPAAAATRPTVEPSTAPPTAPASPAAAASREASFTMPEANPDQPATPEHDTATTVPSPAAAAETVPEISPEAATTTPTEASAPAAPAAPSPEPVTPLEPTASPQAPPPENNPDPVPAASTPEPVAPPPVIAPPPAPVEAPPSPEPPPEPEATEPAAMD
jgi:TonB family protein